MRRCGIFGLLGAMVLLSACEEQLPPPPRRPPPGHLGIAPHTTVTMPPPLPKPVKVVKPARRFLEVRGHVTMNHLPISKPVEIPEDAALSTGPDGFALITLLPGNAAQIRANTVVELGRNAQKGVVLNMHSGAVWSLLPEGSDYEIATPSAAASVQGTQVFVHVDKRKGTDICACDGDVLMETLDHKTFHKVVSAGHHEHVGYHFQRKHKKVKATKRPPPTHTYEGEDDLVRLALETRAEP